MTAPEIREAKVALYEISANERARQLALERRNSDRTDLMGQFGGVCLEAAMASRMPSTATGRQGH